MRAALIVLAWVFAIVVVGILFPSDGQTGVDPAELRVGSLITLNKFAYGCESPLKFADAVEHLTNKEITAWRKIVDDRPACFNERDTFAEQKWVVMRMDRRTMQIARSDDRAGRFYWTAIQWGLFSRKQNEMRN